MTQAIKGAAGLLCHFIWITEQPDQTVRETQQISTNFFFSSTTGKVKEKLVLVLVDVVAQFLTNCRQQSQQNKELQNRPEKIF